MAGFPLNRRVRLFDGRVWLSVIALSLLFALALGREAPATLASHNCAAAGSPRGPFDIHAYDASDWNRVYGDSPSLAGYDSLFPGDAYFGLPPIEKGPRTNRTIASQRYVPPSLLKGIAWIESVWSQADNTVPYGAIGPVILSHSCAYGIMQIVSGMENKTGTPTEQQLMVGSHYAYNIAKGAGILAEKWNAAPSFRPIVGDGDPAMVEDWYYAVWSYHGFSFVNHPLNPEYDMLRAPYRCDGTQSRHYPYQELVYGCVNSPPSAVVGSERVQLWTPQPATLPDLRSEPVFTAMSINNFLFDVPKMDIPRPEPGHPDATPLTGDRAQLVGAPHLSVSSTDLSFDLIKGDAIGAAASATVDIHNAGTGPLAWMALPSDAWIAVNRPQGIALGTDLGGGSAAVTITVDSANLEAGLYEGTLKLAAPYAGGHPVFIAVRVNVYGRSFVPGISKD